jgi:hypothetical protein
VPLYDEFVDARTGVPMVRIFQTRVPVPVRGAVGDIATITVDRRRFQGVIKRIDKDIAVLALG